MRFQLPKIINRLLTVSTFVFALGLLFDNAVCAENTDTPADTDHDGVYDVIEDIDGTNSLDPGSARDIFGNTWCSEWNGFFGMYNVNEYENTSNVDQSVVATLYDVSATSQSETTITVPASGKADLLVHGLQGFTADSYGKVCSVSDQFNIVDIGILTPPTSGLVGQTGFYKPNATGFDFAFALPYSAGLSGSQFTLFNTYQPSQDPADSANVVTNWIEVSNLDDSQQSGALIYYAQDGTVLGTEDITLAGQARSDFAAHQFGANRVGLVEWRPVDSNAKFITRNVRYYYDNSSFQESFASAMQIEGRKGNGEMIGVALDTRNKFTALEIGNTAETAIGVDVVFYSEDGTELDSRHLSIDGYATVHIIVNEILDNALGAVTLDSDTLTSVVAVAMHYGKTASSGLKYAYGLPAKEAFGDTLTSSYNTFLDQGCELLLENTVDVAATSVIRIARLDGTTILEGDDVVTPAHGTTSYDLCGKDDTDQYGVVTIQTDLNRVIATVIRDGANDDYRFPTPAKAARVITICSAEQGATGC